MRLDSEDTTLSSIVAGAPSNDLDIRRLPACASSCGWSRQMSIAIVTQTKACKSHVQLFAAVRRASGRGY